MKDTNVVIAQGERSHCCQDLEFHWCSSDQNSSGILSNHWEHAEVSNTIRELFDYQGDITLIKPD